MKILGAILGIILILLVGAYTIAFTDFGNSITKPYVEKILKEKTGYDIKLREFDLNIDDLDISDIESETRVIAELLELNKKEK